MKYFRINLLLLAVTLSSLGSLISVNQASALSASDWNASNIIDDGIFYDNNSMSTADIQAFMNSKNPSCDTNGTKPASEYGRPDLTHAQYATQVAGWPGPPYVCLRDYYQVPRSDQNINNLSTNVRPEGSISAAEIIKRASDTYGVSPKVLLVLIQKESVGPLLTDTWPIPAQYRSVVGYGCPDTAPCDAKYAGFYNQIMNAAYQFKYYKDHAYDKDADGRYWYNHQPYNTVELRFNPNINCGSTWTRMDNYATTGLYNYTPYQPNQAALDDMYGYGDDCSAHGNRNFWTLFTNWFGSTKGGGNPYRATYVSQSSYPTINPGQSKTVQIRYRNDSTLNWYDNVSATTNNAKPTKLGTANPVNRSSVFGSSWGGDKNRATSDFKAVYQRDGQVYASNPHIVKPGESVIFEFTLSASSSQKDGVYREYFAPLIEGYGYMDASSVFLDVNVQSIPKAAFKSQSSSPVVKPGESAEAWMEFTNTGAGPWYDNTAIANGAAPKGTKPVRLATGNPNNRASIFGATWGSSKNRPTGIFSKVYNSSGVEYGTNPHVVKPGESARFTFKLSAPNNQAAAAYDEYFEPILEGGDPWYMGVSGFLRVTVPTASAAKTSVQSLSTEILPLSEKTVTYSFLNTGNTTWTKSNTTLVVTGGDITELQDESWQSPSVIGGLNEASVAPGSTGTFTVTYSSPAKAASYSFTLSPAVNGSPIASTTLQTKVSVAKPAYSAKFKGQSAYPVATKNSTVKSHFLFENTGNITWFKGTGPAGTHPINLATGNSNNRSSIFGATWGSDRNRPTGITRVYEADGTTLAADQTKVLRGQIAQFEFTFTIPQDLKAGIYREWFEPVAEGSPNWYMGVSGFLDVKVSDSQFSAQYAGQSAYPTISKGASGSAYFKFKNTGNTTWYDTSNTPKGLKPTVLATSGPINRTSLFFPTNRPATTFARVYETDGTTLAANQGIASPGQIVEFAFTLSAPQDAELKTYREWFEPIIEGGNPAPLNYRVFLDVKVD